MKDCACMQIAYLNEISATWSHDNTPDQRICAANTFVFFFMFTIIVIIIFFSGYCRRRSGSFKSVNYRPSSACKMWNLCGLITIWFVVRAHRMFIICLCSWFMCETAGTLELWIMWGIEVKIRELQVNNNISLWKYRVS